MNRGLFLDRDGTINVDIGPRYISNPADARLIPGSARAIIEAQRAGFKVAIITNQAGVAKGHTPPEALPRVHAHIEKLIEQEAGVGPFRFDDIQVCEHHPNDRCLCRKPETQMLERSIKVLGVDARHSYFVGDKRSDIQCGKRLALRTALVRTGHGVETEKEMLALPKDDQPDLVGDDLAAVVKRILDEA